MITRGPFQPLPCCDSVNSSLLLVLVLRLYICMAYFKRSDSTRGNGCKLKGDLDWI